MQLLSYIYRRLNFNGIVFVSRHHNSAFIIIIIIQDCVSYGGITSHAFGNIYRNQWFDFDSGNFLYNSICPWDFCNFTCRPVTLSTGRLVAKPPSEYENNGRCIN